MYLGIVLVDFFVLEVLHIECALVFGVRHIGGVGVLEVLPGRRSDVVVHEIDCVEADGFLASLHSYTVNVAEEGFHVGS